MQSPSLRIRSAKRIIMWIPAVLAGLMLVFWPAIADAACCCRKADSSAAIHQAVPACPHCEADSSSRCDTGKTTAGDATITCGQWDDCSCGIGCRSNFLAILAAHNQTRLDASASFLPSVDSVEFPRGTPLVSHIADTSNPRFLLAQDHCAQICCWLK